MKNEILDHELDNENERKKVKIINWISIIILWSGIGYCGINGFLGDSKLIAATVLLSFSTVITFFNYELGVRVTFGTILIGIMNLVNFFPIIYLVGLRIGGIDIGFEVFLLGIGIIHYFTNKEELSKFLKDLLNREMKEEEIKSAQRSKINGFKNRFSNRPITELKKIVKNNSLLPEAIKAAEELIEEKKENKIET